MAHFQLFRKGEATIDQIATVVCLKGKDCALLRFPNMCQKLRILLSMVQLGSESPVLLLVEG